MSCADRGMLDRALGDYLFSLLSRKLLSATDTHITIVCGAKETAVQCGMRTMSLAPTLAYLARDSILHISSPIDLLAR